MAHGKIYLVSKDSGLSGLPFNQQTVPTQPFSVVSSAQDIVRKSDNYTRKALTNKYLGLSSETHSPQLYHLPSRGS